MHSKNLVLDGRHLSANLLLGAEDNGLRAALISIHENGVEIALLKLVTPLPLAAITFSKLSENEFLEECWRQAIKDEHHHIKSAEKQYSEKPHIVRIE
ncbi:MAG: hypothetical protein ABSB19_02930 [Methylomonas sp.]|jgi:hypothetical protein